MAVTWIGQAAALLQVAGLNILTDPFLSHRASPVQFAGPKRVRAPGLSVEDLPEIDIILLSHNHYDHMDLPALKRIARRFRPRLLTPLRNSRHLRNLSLEIEELDWGADVKCGPVRIILTPAVHWSKRSPFDTNRSLWGAFVIETPAGTIYFAGDTGYGNGETFREIRRHFGPPRLSLLPIGSYEPRWFMKYHHMNPDDAVRAHLDLGSETSVAIHHSTIQLTDEAIDAPAMALREAGRKYGIGPDRFRVLEVGETLLVL